MTQAEAILAHLRRAPITPLEALDLYGCFRLGARIYDLKREGHPIESELVQANGKQFARYSLLTGQLPLFQARGSSIERPSNGLGHRAEGHY